MSSLRAGVLVLVILAGCSKGDGQPGPTTTVTTAKPPRLVGFVTVPQGVGIFKVGEECSTFSRSHEDFVEGARVVLSDGTGRVVATANLNKGGVLVEDSCTFPFDFGPVVPLDIYQVSIAGRKPLAISEAEVEDSSLVADTLAPYAVRLVRE
jgi:hypothetical protein